MSKGHRAGGGIASKNVTERPVRTGVGAKGVNTKYVSRVGQSIGNKATEKRGVIPYVREDMYGGGSFRPVPLGNTLVNNIGKGGPGTGRNVYASGSQCVTPAPTPRPRGRDIG
jgi:hypothetical protein